METIINYAYLIAALVVAISIHEAAHALVAYKLGDDTAKYHGRLTLNPAAHLDPLGTIMLFLAGFGWGKPVPVNSNNFKNPVEGSALTAFAGPLSNFATALICSIPLKYFPQILPYQIYQFLLLLLDLSIILGIFNMLPFPPLDGSKIFAVFIPKNKREGYFDFLQRSQKYFVIFILVDLFLIRRYLGYSILWLLIGNLHAAVKALVFLGG
ncbi:site-2 protease family protein [Patescibacteria group bacterium]|nr:site-2 protease family protein [Patescibacteria group bacterium]